MWFWRQWCKRCSAINSKRHLMILFRLVQQIGSDLTEPFIVVVLPSMEKLLQIPPGQAFMETHRMFPPPGFTGPVQNWISGGKRLLISGYFILPYTAMKRSQVSWILWQLTVYDCEYETTLQSQILDLKILQSTVYTGGDFHWKDARKLVDMSESWSSAHGDLVQSAFEDDDGL